MRFKLLRRISLYLSLLTAISAAVFAQQQQQLQPTAPRVDRLREYVTYLASDALEGRRTGSAGASDAAHYIAGEFARFGLRSGMQAARPPRTRGEMLSRYLQHFPYVASAELGKANVLSFSSGTRPPQSGGNSASQSNTATPAGLRVGEDWMPLGFSSNGQLENLPATIVGYGITAPEQNHDDYANANVSGRIAIAFAGTPDGENPHGQFARYDDVRWKAIAARNAGAKALFIFTREENFKDDRLSRLRYDNNAGSAGLPVAVISRQAAQRILTASELSLTRLEEALHVKRSAIAAAQPNNAAIPLPNLSLTIATDVVRREAPASNVVGILDGSDPKLKSEVIVVGAHYDHLGRGGEGSLASREGEIHHGADDNASGVAGILELARILSSEVPKPRRSIVFIAFSGEEEGLLGSNFYVNHPLVPLASTVAMVNMDMIGRMKEKKLIVGGVGTAQEWNGWLESATSGSGLATTANVPAGDGGSAGTLKSRQFALTLNQDGYGPSDHSSFYAKQVPVLFFWTGTHDDYHKPSDTADKINYEDEVRILLLVAQIIRDIDKSDKRPSYTVAKSESTGRSTGFRVYLGTIPNYAEANDGLKLDGVRDDSPASRAGLKVGDRIVKLAGRDVRNVYDYTYALGEMKAGQEYEVELIRGSERLVLKITPTARR